MQRATSIIGPASSQVATANRTITLTRDERYRRRLAMRTDCGLEFLLDLPEATYLPHGTGLVLDSGEVIRVVAAPEPLLEISADSPTALTRIAWHIGNRHTAAEIAAGALYIQADHVLAEMVRGLGGTVNEVTRPFEPEGGAYGHHGSLHASHHHGDHASGRDHGHHHKHSHD